MKYLFVFVSLSILFPSCCCQSSKNKCIGYVTHFGKSGIIWKSNEVQVNMSQTGMTSTANELDVSVDNDNEDSAIINKLDSAATYGWKVEIAYRQTFGSNFMCNRGETAKFITSVTVLERNPRAFMNEADSSHTTGGKVIDTIYVVIKPK